MPEPSVLRDTMYLLQLLRLSILVLINEYFHEYFHEYFLYLKADKLHLLLATEYAAKENRVDKNDDGKDVDDDSDDSDDSDDADEEKEDAAILFFLTAAGSNHTITSKDSGKEGPYDNPDRYLAMKKPSAKVRKQISTFLLLF
jgi:hypothetical protein